MSLIKSFSLKSIISFTVSFSLLVILINFQQITARSQNSANNTTTPEPVIFNPPPVEDNGAPGGRQKGAGSHSLCKIAAREEDITPLIAVMPKIAIKSSTKNKVYVWGKTTLAHPTFWVYVAYPINSYAEFTLQDEADNEIYQTTVKLDKTPGIIGLNLPPNRVSLETGKSYHWYFNIMCDPENSTDDFVDGWVERVKLNPVIHSQLELAPALAKISVYAENGLWYDTLNTVDRLRQTEPENKAIAAIWNDLLQQVDLDEISQEPIVKRYNLEN